MIIALSGIPGSGKDTVGRAVQERLNNLKGRMPKDSKLNSSYSIKKFAGITNEVYTKITGVNYSKADRETHEQHRSKFREFAEKMKDIFGKDIWVKGLIDKYDPAYSNNWIITDLRFMEEVIALHGLENNHDDVFLFRIRRICEKCYMVETHAKDCESNNITSVETKLAGYYGWDKIVNNNGTPEEAAEEIVTYILNHYNISIEKTDE